MSIEGKALIFSAPSGSGKTTIVHHLLNVFSEIRFSISATTRPMRGEEKDGRDYYFLSVDEFKKKVDNDEFFEFEEVYPGRFYGTLKSEVYRLWEEGYHVIFDVDVVGGVNLKSSLREAALGVFVKVGNIDQLRQRLIDRKTESAEEIEKRVSKATIEMSYEKKFDRTLINDDLNKAFSEAEEIVTDFLSEA